MTTDADDAAVKALLDVPAAPFDPDLSLQRVLLQARRQTSARDLLGFFFSWFWVLFAGFGASVHQAATRARLRRGGTASRRTSNSV